MQQIMRTCSQFDENTSSTHQQLERWFQTQKKSINEETTTAKPRQNSIVQESPYWPVHQLDSQLTKKKIEKVDPKNVTEVASYAERARRLQQELKNLDFIGTGVEDVGFKTSERENQDFQERYNNYLGKENIMPVATDTISLSGTLKECGTASPFTQFLTEMNSRINKQALGATLEHTIEQSHKESQDCCWLREDYPIENSTTSRSNYSQSDLLQAKQKLMLLKTKLLAKTTRKMLPVVMQKPQGNGVVHSVNIQNSYNLNSLKVVPPKILMSVSQVVTNLVKCETCGRSFNQQAFAKHPQLCQKIQPKKRIVSAQPPQQQCKDVPKWKLQSQEFRKQFGRTGENFNIEEAKTLDGRIKCDHCSRMFNDEAFKRHNPFCASKAKANALKKNAQAQQPKKQFSVEMQRAIRGFSAARRQ